MKKTPFYDLLTSRGGKMVEFAGYAMPIQFAGIIAEHKAVRERAGLFDVSHMAEFILKGEGALQTLERLVTNVMGSLAEGKARYSLMLNDKGGVVDDILVYKLAESEFMIVANACNYQKDMEHIKANLAPGAHFEDITEDTALLALQGREAQAIMLKLFADEQLPRDNYSFTKTSYKGRPVILSRTGYTGEDGFEIFLPASFAAEFFEDVTATDSALVMCGLGARDTLRLEAAMPLYGHEMNEDTWASEIGLGWFIKADAKDFIGRSALIKNSPKYKRAGLKIAGRGIAREHMKVFGDGKEIGCVTSGTFSPTLGYPIAMVRIERDYEKDYADIEIRGEKVRAQLTALPFYKRQK